MDKMPHLIESPTSKRDLKSATRNRRDTDGLLARVPAVALVKPLIPSASAEAVKKRVRLCAVVARINEGIAI